MGSIQNDYQSGYYQSSYPNPLQENHESFENHWKDQNNPGENPSDQFHRGYQEGIYTPPAYPSPNYEGPTMTHNMSHRSSDDMTSFNQYVQNTVGWAQARHMTQGHSNSLPARFATTNPIQRSPNHTPRVSYNNNRYITHKNDVIILNESFRVEMGHRRQRSLDHSIIQSAQDLKLTSNDLNSPRESQIQEHVHLPYLSMSHNL